MGTGNVLPSDEQGIASTSHPEMLAVSELGGIFTGKLIVDGDVDYEHSRKIWNGMIDRKPSLIAQCANTNDICVAVQFAKKHKMLLAIKAGGHNVSGNAVCDGGMMIDLSLMKNITVNAAERFADVQTGATWAEFDAAAQTFGLATTGGVVSSTGVAGLTLGGGVGWLVRKHGLSCDNLIGAEVITADGKIVNASTDENPDLFWGIRGGGGNFGVVSSMRFRLHEVGTVLGGIIIHPRDKAPELLRFYRDFIRTAPNELTLYAGLLTSPDGIPVIALIGCYCGDLETGEKVIKPLREFGTPVADLMQPMPYQQVQTLIDATVPHGHRYYWKSGFLKDCSDESIDLIVSHMASNPSPYSATIFEFYGGSSINEPAGGTSYPHREPLFDLVIISNWIEASDDQANINWNRNLWSALRPHMSSRVYVNAMGVEGEQRVVEAYGESYKRLRMLKLKYDPDNFFRMNQNIVPV